MFTLGHAMAQIVNRRPLTADSLIQSHDPQYGICGKQSGAGVSHIINQLMHSIITVVDVKILL